MKCHRGRALYWAGRASIPGRGSTRCSPCRSTMSSRSPRTMMTSSTPSEDDHPPVLGRFSGSILSVRSSPHDWTHAAISAARLVGDGIPHG